MGARRCAVFAIVFGLWLFLAPPAHAGLLRGLMYMVAGILEVPRSALAGTVNGPPIVGTVFGALAGTVRGLGLLTRGAIETAGGAAGLALKAAPFIPIFL